MDRYKDMPDKLALNRKNSFTAPFVPQGFPTQQTPTLLGALL